MPSAARTYFAAFAVLASLLAVSAQQQTCNATSPCGKTDQCCSSYGFCGTGPSFCFQGCNPEASYSLTSCNPDPVCVSQNITFPNSDRILSNASYYDGNASKWDFVVNEGNIMISNSSGSGELAMILTETNNGTRLTSTRYVHYGQITAKMTTGQWNGVVVAFITMSDVKDEIDWEFTTNSTSTGQTNYFWQGDIPAQTAGMTVGNISDTFTTAHEYTIDWQQDQLTWLVDGDVVRTVTKAETTDNTTGIAYYPNTPSAIELSIWPAGISSEPAGTVQWAGGMINWQDPDYQSAGDFYAMVEWVSVTCNDPTPPTPDITSYVYGPNSSAFTPDILLSNETTISGAPGLRALAWGAGWSVAVAGVAALLGSGIF